MNLVVLLEQFLRSLVKLVIVGFNQFDFLTLHCALLLYLLIQ